MPSPRRSGSQPWAGVGTTKAGVLSRVLTLSHFHGGGGCISPFRLRQQKVIGWWLNNTFLSHSSGSWMSEVRVLVRNLVQVLDC